MEEVSINKAIPELTCTQEIKKEATDDNAGITNNYTSPGGQKKCSREMAMGEGKTTMTAWWRIIALLWACSQIEVYEGEAIQNNSILGNARQMEAIDNEKATDHEISPSSDMREEICDMRSKMEQNRRSQQN